MTDCISGILIDEDCLIRRECECNCPTNHQCLQLSLTPLDCIKDHNSIKNEYYWQNICKCSNCTSEKSQIASIDQSKMFNFDAIQVIKNEKLQQLPEMVSREIVKNSKEIIFEKEKNISKRNPIKINDVKSKLLIYNQDIFSEERKDILMQRTLKKDIINKENKEDNQEIFEGNKKDVSMQTILIRFDKDKNKIFKDNQNFFFKEAEDLSEMIRLEEEKADILKNSQEIIHEETNSDFLKRNMIWLNEKNVDNLKNCQGAIFKKEEEALERKLVKLCKRDKDILKNHHIYEEQLAFIKVKENSNNIRNLIKHAVYKPKKEYKKSNEFAKKKTCREKKKIA